VCPNSTCKNCDDVSMCPPPFPPCEWLTTLPIMHEVGAGTCKSPNHNCGTIRKKRMCRCNLLESFSLRMWWQSPITSVRIVLPCKSRVAVRLNFKHTTRYPHRRGSHIYQNIHVDDFIEGECCNVLLCMVMMLIQLSNKTKTTTNTHTHTHKSDSQFNAHTSVQKKKKNERTRQKKKEKKDRHSHTDD
jgi:hypothetical protein